MTEHDRLAFTPIFIIDSYSVFGFDVAHNFFFLVSASFIFAAFNSTKPGAALGLIYAKWILFLQRESVVWARATFSGLREFQESSAARTFLIVVLRVNGGREDVFRFLLSSLVRKSAFVDQP
jgi:hypothetical protein